MKTDAFHFATLEDFLTVATAPPSTTIKNPARDCNSLSDGQPEWNGSRTFAEAVDMARNGWPEGMAKLAAARELVTMPEGVASLVPVPQIAEDGEFTTEDTEDAEAEAEES